MLKSEVQIDGHYTAKVSGKIAIVKICCPANHGQGYCATNVITGRDISIKSAAKLRQFIPLDKLAKYKEIYMANPKQLDEEVK